MSAFEVEDFFVSEYKTTGVTLFKFIQNVLILKMFFSYLNNLNIAYQFIKITKFCKPNYKLYPVTQNMSNLLIIFTIS